MSNKIRISHVSTIGQIIHFLRDYCLIIYLFTLTATFNYS